jgi:Spy/CpxP family protein refolding chaperone
MKALHSLIGAAAAVALAAGVVVAQEPQPDSTAPRARMRIHEPGTGLQQGVTPRQRQLGQGGRFDGGGFAPGLLLRQREFLDLTDEQVAQLEQLESTVRAEQDKAREVYRARQGELREAWQADDPDSDLIRQKTAEAMEARHQMELTRIESAAKAKGLLTDAQLGKVRGFQEGMRRGSGMHGDRSAPGMQRGSRRSPDRMRAHRRYGELPPH